MFLACFPHPVLTARCQNLATSSIRAKSELAPFLTDTTTSSNPVDNTSLLQLVLTTMMTTRRRRRREDAPPLDALHLSFLLFFTLIIVVPLVVSFTASSKTIRSSPDLHERKDWATSLFPVLPTTTSSANQRQQQRKPSQLIIKESLIPPPDKGFLSQASCQFFAGSIGALTGFGIAGFKRSIEAIREYAYGDLLMDKTVHDFPTTTILIPAVGGMAVGLLAALGRINIATNGDGEGTTNNNIIRPSFPPGVRGIVDQVDQDSLGNNDQPILQELADSLRKASASIVTLGTGCSLGPEGPGVEIGIAASRICALLWPQQLDSPTARTAVAASNSETCSDELLRNAIQIQRNRLFLACGAAAGVSSGFNAPLAGVFFALEVIQKNLPPIDIPASSLTATEIRNGDSNVINGIDGEIDDGDDGRKTIIYEFQQGSLSTEAGTITPILTSSVVSALIIRILLGNELALRLLEYEIPTPLRELPLYLLLGATSGLVAVVFSQTAKLAKAGFDGEIGPEPVRNAIKATPDFVKPVVGGLTCGIVGAFFPNILFFGYETLNGLLLNNQLDAGVAIVLLMAKLFATAVSAASGLVGGTLAPTLFMGGMVGAAFHEILVNTLGVSTLDFATSAFGTAFQIADLPAYTMVGAASFLAAVFRAPLTASLLAFELTKNYDVLVPLLASAGVGTLLCDLVETRLEQPTTKR